MKCCGKGVLAVASGVLGLVLFAGEGSAQTTGTLLHYDFETVPATNLFVTGNTVGCLVSNTTVEAIGAGNTISSSDTYASRFGMGSASNQVMRFWHPTNNFATCTATEHTNKNSAVMAAFNALPPGVYYLRISLDQNRIGGQTLKIGVGISGSNGGVNQGARGGPGTAGWYGGLDSGYGGIQCNDSVADNNFIKCVSEFEQNNKINNGIYPWRIKIVPASQTPDDVNVFRQGRFISLSISIWETGGTNPDCYFDNIKIEYQKIDPFAPIYLNDLLRAAQAGPAVKFTTDYVDYTAVPPTAPGDGMVELVGFMATNNVATTNYTRAGAAISFAPYVHNSGASFYWGSVGSGIFGGQFQGTSAYNRSQPLWIAGDGQTDPTNRVAIWDLIAQGKASPGFGFHANQFITFNTQKIRSYLLDGRVNRLLLTGRFGMHGASGSASATVRGGVWVDGVQQFLSGAKKREDASEPFCLVLTSGSHYVTFAVLDDAALDWTYDVGVFKDVKLTVLPGGTVVGIQ